MTSTAPHPAAPGRGRRRLRFARRFAPLVVVAAAAGAALAACTDPPAPAPPSASTTAPARPGSPTTTRAAAADAATPLGVKYDWSKVSDSAAYLTGSLERSPAFFEFQWCDIERTQGNRDWKQLDRIVAQAATVDAELMLKIRVGTCWATGNRPAQFSRGEGKPKTESFLPADLNTYAAFVTAVVQRYSPQGVKKYALENEVNGASFWGSSVQDCEKLVEVGAAAIRAGDPAAKVVDSGISSTGYGAAIANRLLTAGRTGEAVAAYNAYYARRFGTRSLAPVSDEAGLRAALDTEQARRNIDYLAMADRLATRKVVDIRQVHFYEKWDVAPLVVDYLKAGTPAEVALEAWEVGQFLKDAELDDATRADEMVKSVAILMAGGARSVLWLPLVNDPSGKSSDEPRYGLLDPDGSVRATGKAYAAMAAAARGATVTHVAAAGVTGVAYERSGRTEAFVWSSASEAALTLPAGAQLTAATADTPSTPGSGTVTVGGSPRRIVFDGPAPTLWEKK